MAFFSYQANSAGMWRSATFRSGTFRLPSLHFLCGGYCARSAHNPVIHVGHGEVRAVQCSNGLVAGRLLFKAGKIAFKVLIKRGRFEVP